MSAYLLVANELYALPILRPLAQAARERGHRLAWIATDALAARLQAQETRLQGRQALQRFAPDAVYAVTHRLPPQLPGKKIQLFHGLSIDKRDPKRNHFHIRGLFDLYCTHGPISTGPFLELAKKHAHFAVEETGWPKLDPLFAGSDAGAEALRGRAGGRPVVMYASTFTTSLSSAEAFFDTLQRLVAGGEWYWLLTLHPKCPPELMQRYRSLAGPHAEFLEADRLLDMLRAADTLVCDTSSVIEEFGLLLKPIVTIRNRRPKPFMLDVAEPAQVEAAVRTALQRPGPQLQALRAFADAIHPWRDGRASERVLDATDKLLAGDYGNLRRKPLNLLRRWKAKPELQALLPGD